MKESCFPCNSQKSNLQGQCKVLLNPKRNWWRTTGENTMPKLVKDSIFLFYPKFQTEIYDYFLGRRKAPLPQLPVKRCSIKETKPKGRSETLLRLK